MKRRAVLLVNKKSWEDVEKHRNRDVKKHRTVCHFDAIECVDLHLLRSAFCRSMNKFNDEGVNGIRAN